MTGRVVAAVYVLMVAALATVGFATDATAPILLAGALALPTSIPAGIGFYAVVGLLGLAPGANPDSSTGSGGCSADGLCSSTSTGDAATWFLVTTDVLGVVALAAAAALNVVVASRLVRGRRAASARTRSGA